MARLQLSKSALSRERRNLRTFERFLPSLDLKRRQLTVESEKARAAHREAQDAVERYEQDFGQKLPMVAWTVSERSQPVMGRSWRKPSSVQAVGLGEDMREAARV